MLPVADGPKEVKVVPSEVNTSVLHVDSEDVSVPKSVSVSDGAEVVVNELLAAARWNTVVVVPSETVEDEFQDASDESRLAVMT